MSRCDTNIDHVVSLKDAHDSGAEFWNNSLKVQFANDKDNLLIASNPQIIYSSIEKLEDLYIHMKNAGLKLIDVLKLIEESAKTLNVAVLQEFESNP